MQLSSPLSYVATRAVIRQMLLPELQVNEPSETQSQLAYCITRLTSDIICIIKLQKNSE